MGMKRPIAILLLVAALGATALYEYKFPVELPSFETVYPQLAPQQTVIKVPVLTELGNPTSQRYTAKSANSRNPWDIAVLDGKLYVGSGDYGKNTGPCDMWQYDPETEQWTSTGQVNDEAVANFEILDGKLIATGTDPKADWEYGSFYTLTQDGWQTDRTVPFGVHMFDIADHKGKRFYAIGTAGCKQSPVQITKDGENYVNVPFYIDETALIDNTDYGYFRCYNLFESESELYAFCYLDSANRSYGFFKYDGEAFRLVTPFSDLKLKSKGTNRQVIFNKGIAFNGRFYFSTGYLYSTEDFTKAEIVPFSNDTYVQDMTVQDGKMYVLTSKELKEETVDENGQPLTLVSYENTVWEYYGADDMTEVYSFEYKQSAMSFEKYGDIYYIGIGKQTDEPATTHDSPMLLNGNILRLEFVEKVITK